MECIRRNSAVSAGSGAAIHHNSVVGETRAPGANSDAARDRLEARLARGDITRCRTFVLSYSDFVLLGLLGPVLPLVTPWWKLAVLDNWRSHRRLLLGRDQPEKRGL